MTPHRSLLSWLMLTMLFGCALGGRTSETVQSRPDIIAEEEIRGSQLPSLLEFISRVRPAWLRGLSRPARTNTIMQNRDLFTGDRTGSPDLIEVFVDGYRVGNGHALVDLRPQLFREITRHTPLEAAELFGTVGPYTSVVINATTR